MDNLTYEQAIQILADNKVDPWSLADSSQVDLVAKIYRRMPYEVRMAIATVRDIYYNK